MKKKKVPKWLYLVLSIVSLSLITFFLLDYPSFKVSAIIGKPSDDIRFFFSKAIQVSMCSGIGCLFSSGDTGTENEKKWQWILSMVLTTILLFYYADKGLSEAAINLFLQRGRNYEAVPVYLSPVLKQFVVQKVLDRTNAYAILSCEVFYFLPRVISRKQQ